MFWIPSLIIVTLSFSRNALLALAVAVLVGLLSSRRIKPFLVAFVSLVGVVSLAFLLSVAAPVLADLPGGTFVNNQVASYTERVVGGLRPDALASDSSIQFREFEARYLSLAFSERPAIGHGFGYAYKPSLTANAFQEDYAPYYSHNFPFWVLVKSGIVGALLFFLPVVMVTLRLLRTSSVILLAAATPLISYVVISFVAPVPLGTTSCMLFGLALGASVAAAQGKPIDDSLADSVVEPLTVLEVESDCRGAASMETVAPAIRK
nr:O-antigen ligase family protein [Frigoribacterium sp. CFBP 13712]